VCPGFVIGDNMIWTKIICDFMKAKELVSPPLHRTLPVIEVEDLGKRIRAVVESNASKEQLEFADRMTIMQFIQYCTNGENLALPKIIEQENPPSRHSNQTSLPRELFYFSKNNS
jgi:hypothetical protein